MENTKDQSINLTPIDYRLDDDSLPEDFSALIDYSNYDDQDIAGFFVRNGLHLVCIQGETFSSEIKESPDHDGKYFIGFAGYRLEFGRLFDSPYQAFTWIMSRPVVLYTTLNLITNHLFYESVSLQPIPKSSSDE